MTAAIRGVIAEIAAEAATTVRIQYGGSVTDDDAGALLAEPHVDGRLDRRRQPHPGTLR